MNCPNLKIWDLSKNEIKKLEDFDGLAKVEVLKLNNNQISDQSGLKSMPELKSLILSNNKIKNLSNFDSFPKLEILNLMFNSILVFEENIPDFENLHTLNLVSNKIEKIEEMDKLISITKLINLDISFNPFIEKNKNNYLFYILSKLNNLNIINNLTITWDIRKQTHNYCRKLWEEEQKRLAEENKEEEDN